MHTPHHFISGCLLAIASLLPAAGCAAEPAAPPAAPVTTAEAVALPDFATMWQPGWQCGREAPLSKALLQSLLKQRAVYGYALNGVPLPMLLGKNPDQLGSILFVQHQGGWHAWPVADGGEVLAAYSTPAFNRVMLFATWGRQGPGNDYVVMHGKRQLGEFGCTTLHFPAELNRPDWGNKYPAVQAFNMDAQGRGTLFTAAKVPAGPAEETHWYQYFTPDWGRSWSEARNVRGAASKLRGIFQPVSEIPPPRWLVESLLASAP